MEISGVKITRIVNPILTMQEFMNFIKKKYNGKPISGEIQKNIHNDIYNFTNTLLQYGEVSENFSKTLNEFLKSNIIIE